MVVFIRNLRTLMGSLYRYVFKSMPAMYQGVAVATVAADMEEVDRPGSAVPLLLLVMVGT